MESVVWATFTMKESLTFIDFLFRMPSVDLVNLQIVPCLDS